MKLNNNQMKKPENIALFDLDGSLCNYYKAMQERLAKLRSPLEKHSNPNDPWIKERENLIKSLPGFWENLEPIENGFKVLELVQSIGFTPHVLTKGPHKNDNAWTEKARWCRKYLPGIDVTITEDKGLTYGKILFDDWPDYANRWLTWRPRGLVVMLSQPWNVGFYHPNVFLVNQDDMEQSLYQLKPLLERIFER